jgi:hypothetical protein
MAKTLVVIPFSINPAYGDENSQSEGTKLQRQARSLYFESTFFSIASAGFSHFYISVNGPEAAKIVEEVTSCHGAHKVTVLDLGPTSPQAQKAHQNSPTNNENQDTDKVKSVPDIADLQPRDTLDAVVSLLESPQGGTDFKYVYYTEGDQLLHLRPTAIRFLLDSLDFSDKNFPGGAVLLPHRMLPFATNQVMPRNVHFLSPSSPSFGHPNTTLTTELAGHITKGSCCDNGRIEIPDCGNFWYICNGIRGIGGDRPSHVSFGQYGMALPLVTEHKGICNYSPDRKQCPVPDSCGGVRMPQEQGWKKSCSELINSQSLDQEAWPLKNK